MVKSEPKHRRRWLTWTGIIVGALVIIVLLLPTIVSYIIVPGMIQSAIAKQVDGKVEVSGTSFSWFGSQEIKTIKVASTDEETMIDASVTIDRSLFGLMFGWPNLGKVVVTASGKGTLEPDGSTSFTSLQTKEKSTPSKDGPAMPAGLEVDLVLDVSSLELTVEEMNSSVVISDLQAKAVVQAGGPIDLALKTTVQSDGKSGNLDLKFKLDNGVAADGRLQLTNASLSGALSGQSLRLPAAGQWVEIDALDFTADSRALGEGLQANGSASGTLQNSTPISLQAKLDLGSLVRKDGSFMFGPDSLSGTVHARSIPTSLLQPFLGDSPVQLVRDIGPQLDLSLDATSGSARSMHLEMEAKFITVKADMTVSADRVSNGTMTIDMTVSRNVLEQAGVVPDGELRLTVKGTGLGMTIGSDGQPDIASFMGEIDMATSGSLGTPQTGQLKLSGLDLKIVTKGLQEGVDVNADGIMGTARLKAAATLKDLLVDGTIDMERAAIDGTLALMNFDLKSIEPLLGDAVPEGVLADMGGGALIMNVSLHHKDSVTHVNATASAPDLNGFLDVKITDSSIQMSEMKLTCTMQAATVDAFMPEPNTMGHLTSPLTLVMTSNDFAYDLASDDSVSTMDRIAGKIQASVKQAGFKLMNPEETVVLDDLTADVTITGKHALEIEADAKIATDKNPIGSARMTATVPDLNQFSIPKLATVLKLDDTRSVATIAGIDPAPMMVVLGPTATVKLDVSPPASADDSIKIEGTVQSERATGQFDAQLAGPVLESAKLDFTTKLVPGDFEKALGSSSNVRLSNNVTLTVQADARDFGIAGGSSGTQKATMKMTATSMQLTGEDGTKIVVNGTNGTTSVNGRVVKADFSASIANRSGSEGNGRVKLATNAKLPAGEEAFQIGDTVLELDSVPTFIFELVGAEGRLAEAALGKSVNSKATVTAAGAGRSSVKAEVTSPYASLNMPQAWLEKSLFDIPADQKIHADLKVSPELSREILSVLHPIFADIATSQKPISLKVGPLTLPLSGDQASKLNGKAVLDIGEVSLKSTSFGSHLLMFLGNTDGSSVPARFSPLKVTAINGLVEYKDFTMEIGQGEGRGYKQKLVFNGKINLASDPPEVIGISASFPATNLAGAFGELRKVPPGLLATIRPKVTFYGPLYDAKGNRIPLKSKIDPLSLDEGLKPDQIHGIIQGIGDLIRKKN